MKIGNLSQEMSAMRLEAENKQLESNGSKVTQDFGELLSGAINDVNQLQKTSNELQTKFDLGDRNVSLSDVMIARNKASVGFEATIQVRNKIIDAYQELMRMTV